MSEHQSSTSVTRAADGTQPDRFVDPGVPAHKNRMADTDAGASKRAERQVVTLFVLSIIGTIATIVVYFAIRPEGTTASVRNANLALGLGMFLSLMGIGLAAVHWAKTLMSDHERVEERHEQRSTDDVPVAPRHAPGHRALGTFGRVSGEQLPDGDHAPPPERLLLAVLAAMENCP